MFFGHLLFWNPKSHTHAASCMHMHTYMLQSSQMHEITCVRAFASVRDDGFVPRTFLREFYNVLFDAG
jgi:hypothetical protein